MILKKTHELKTTNNDIFRLIHNKNIIIVNHDYKGIDCLDSSLRTLHYIPIANNITAWAIYNKYDGSSIIVHDPTDQMIPIERHQITIINLKTLEKTTLNPGEAANNCFDKNYYWQDDTVIFITEETDIFYHLDLKGKTLKQISQNTVKKIAPAFFSFWQACKMYSALTVYPDRQAFIFQKSPETIVFFDYLNNKQFETNVFTPNPYTVHYRNGIFLFEYSTTIEIVYNNNRTIIESQYPPYYYLQTSILHDNTIVTLQTNTNDHQHCILETYKLEKS